MPDVLDIGFPERTSLADRMAAPAEQGPGFFSLLRTGAQTEWVTSEIVRKWQRAGFEFAEDWQGVGAAGKEVQGEILEGIPDDMLPGLEGTRSLEHARVVADQLRKIALNESRLAEAGWTGVGARILAAIGDPTVLAASALTGGYGGLAMKAGKYRTLARIGITSPKANTFVIAGAVAALENAAIEGFVGQTDPTRGVEDVLMAGTLGFGLGGGLGVLSRGLGRRAMLKELARSPEMAAKYVRHEIELAEILKAAAGRGEHAPFAFYEQTIDKAGKVTFREVPRAEATDELLTETGKHYFRDQLQLKKARQLWKENVEAQGFKTEEMQDLVAGIEPDDLNALLRALQAAPNVEPPIRVTPPVVEPKPSEPETILDAAFTDVTAKQLPAPEARQLTAGPLVRAGGEKPAPADVLAETNKLLDSVVERVRPRKPKQQAKAPPLGKRAYSAAQLEKELDKAAYEGSVTQQFDDRVIDELGETGGLAVDAKDYSPQELFAFRNAGIVVNEDAAKLQIERLGEDRHRQLVAEKMAGKAGRTRKFVRGVLDNPERHDPELVVKAYLYDRYQNLAPEFRSTNQVFVDPKELPDGTTVSILGDEFTVSHTDEGEVQLKDGITIHNAEQLDKLPVDEGTLKQPEMADIGDEPFVPETRTVAPNTGEGTQASMRLGEKSKLREAFDKYDDTGESTVADLANDVEGLIVEGQAPQHLQDAIDDYRVAIREDFEELAGRGDVESDEKKLVQAIEDELDKEVTASLTPDTGEGAQRGQQLGLLGEARRGGIAGKQGEIPFEIPSRLTQEDAARPVTPDVEGQMRFPGVSERGFVNLEMFDPRVWADLVKAGIAAAKWTVRETYAAALWLLKKGPKTIAAAVRALVGEFGEAIRPRAAQIVDAAAEVAGPAPDAAKAAAKGPTLPPHKAGDFDVRLSAEPVKKIVFNLQKARPSMIGSLGKSLSGLTVKTARAYMPEILPLRSGVAGESGAEFVDRQHVARLGVAVTVTRSHYRKYAESQGWPTIPYGPHWTKFNEDIGVGIRMERGAFTTDPNTNAAIDFFRDQWKDLFELMQRHGVRGLEETEATDTYMSRFWSRGKMHRLEKEVGYENVIDLIKASFRKGGYAVPDALLTNMARTFYRLVNKSHSVLDFDLNRAFAGRDEELLRQVLADAGLGTVEIEQVVAAVHPPKPKGPITSRAKERVDLDENTEHPITDAAGNERVIRITDMLENNALGVFERASRQMLGAAAESKILHAMSVDTGKPLQSFKDLRELVERDLRSVKDANGHALSDKAVNSTLGKMDVFHKSVRGFPLSEDSYMATASRWARLYNSVRLSGRFGLAQLPEFARTTSFVGFRAMLRQMPELSKVFSRAADGYMSDDMGRFIDGIGLGLVSENSAVLSRLADSDAGLEVAMSRGEQVARHFSRLGHKISGLLAVTTWQHRATARFMVQKMFDVATGRGKVSDTRLGVLGMTRERWDRITALLKEHSVEVNGVTGRRVVDIKIGDWAATQDGAEAATDFIVALNRFARRAVQQQYAGDVMQWMTTDVGKVISQFRGYSFVSWDKAVLYNLAMSDWAAFMEVNQAMLIAGLVYTAEQQVVASTRPDRRKYLREHLSPERIAAASFARAGFSAFIPQAADSIDRLLGGNGQMFSTRYTGLSTDLILGNPTFDGFDAGSATATAFAQALRGKKRLTQADVRRGMALIPFARILGVSNLVDAMTKDLPRR